MIRFNDWPERLQEVVAEAQDKRFEWGSHDCALFAMNVVFALTGEDLAISFRGKYRTARGAAGQMIRFAGGGVEEMADKMAEMHDIKETPVAFARRGDVVLIDIESVGPALGIVLGQDATFVSLASGLTRRPLLECRRAWRIGG